MLCPRSVYALSALLFLLFFFSFTSASSIFFAGSFIKTNCPRYAPLKFETMFFNYFTYYPGQIKRETFKRKLRVPLVNPFGCSDKTLRSSVRSNLFTHTYRNTTFIKLTLRELSTGLRIPRENSSSLPQRNAYDQQDRGMVYGWGK